jgi:DNA-binding beta-propeller fold protein YncE
MQLFRMLTVVLLAFGAALAVAAGDPEARASEAAQSPSRALGDYLGRFSAPSGAPNGLENDGFGNLYVADFLLSTIYHINTSGGVVSPPIGLNIAITGNLSGVATDGTNLWVTDISGDKIDHYLLDGTYVSSFSVAAQTTYPEEATYNPNTGNLYLVDSDGSLPDSVIEYTTAGAVVNIFPLPGDANDGIAYDPVRDTYFVYDKSTDLVTNYDVNFNPLESFPSMGAASQQPGHGVAVVGDSLFICESYQDWIAEFDITEAIPVELQFFVVE